MKFHSLIALFALVVFASGELKKSTELEVQNKLQKPVFERLEAPSPQFDYQPSLSHRLAWKSKRGGMR